MKFLHRIFGFLLCAIPFLIPLEQKNGSLFRHFSKWLFFPGIEAPPWFDKRFYFHLTDIVVLLLCALCWRSVFQTANRWLVLFFSLALLSIAASSLSNCPVMYLNLLQLATPFLLFFIVSEKGAEWIRPVLWCFVISGLIQALVGIDQYFHFEQAWLYFFRPSSHPHFVGILPFQGARWVFDRWIENPPQWPYLLRASGTFIHANPLGAFLSISLFSALALYSKQRRWLGATIPVLLFALFLTFSRSALYGAVLGSVFFFWRTRASRELLAILSASLLLSVGLLHEQLWMRGTVHHNEFAAGADVIRVNQNKIALHAIADHPLLGVGYGQMTLDKQYNDWNQKMGIAQVHNSALLIAAEMGIPALLIFAVFLFSQFKMAWPFSANRQVAAPVAALILFLFISLTDFYPFVHQHAKMELFLMLGLLAVQVKAPKDYLENRFRSFSVR